MVAAGLLRGKKASIHWMFADKLSAQFPGSPAYLALAAFALATATPQLLKFNMLEYWTGGAQGPILRSAADLAECDHSCGLLRLR